MARELFEKAGYENAISRAYYAMYHAARAVLLTQNVEPRTYKGVIRKLAELFIKTEVLENAYLKMLA